MLSHRSFWLMIVCSVLIIPLISRADNSMKDPDRFPAEKSAMKADYVPGEIIINSLHRVRAVRRSLPN